MTERHARLLGEFTRELAAAIGCPALSPGDADAAVAAAYSHLVRAPPIYIEDDVAGSGCCAVCGKRAALGRCAKCGLLMHYSCVPPPSPGEPQECPRCCRGGEKQTDPEATDAWSYGQLKKPKYSHLFIVKISSSFEFMFKLWQKSYSVLKTLGLKVTL